MTKDELDKLARCPFCGGEPVSRHILTSSGDKNYFVRCQSCAAEGGWSQGVSGSKRLWNLREPNPQAELDKLAHQIAKGTCRGTLLVSTVNMRDGWRNVEKVAHYDKDLVDTSVTYLEARGLLERHPERSELVRIKEPEEIK